MSAGTFGDALAEQRADELRRATRALLRRPLLRASDEAFVLVRRYGPELREWFGRNAGWWLHIDSEVARLVKQPATTGDATYPARDVRSRQPFGRRRYVLACLALAALERAEAQVTLGRLAEQVVLGAADPELVRAGVVFTLERREERADLVAVVRLLIDLGVLRRVAGDEEAFVKDTGDVLYDVARRALASLLAAELLFAAEAQVAAMNAELGSRPTSTGMRLRLLWRPRENGPAGLEATRERLLRQTADAWSEEDRSAVGEFLQGRIEAERAADATGTWQEHLTKALDYRRWNRFVIQRHQNGQWRSATGPASGGERVLAASVPLFAAAAAHYASAANPHTPRLVTLDEAFAGVDDNARAKYLGLLAAFELDVVMTSEREWGCYPEVPGLAISQLSRTDDVAAVLVTNWEWDGTSRVRVERPVRAVEPVSPVGASTQGGLWT